MGEKLYRYTIKDQGKTIALMDNMKNVLIFLEALNDKYYDEETLRYTIERELIKEED